MVSYTVQQTQGQPGGSAIVDQNLQAIKTELDALEAADPAPSVTSVTKDYAASVNDVHIFAAGSLVVTLVDATKLKGRSVSVKNTATGTVTVAAARAQKVDGAASVSLAAGAGKTFVSDGSNWWSV